jgi:DNA-binding GntR family transcriptional regulator
VWTDEGLEGESFPVLERSYRHHGLDDHDLILRLIERGDAEGAAREARQHLEWTPTYNVRQDAKVVPALLGDHPPGR